MQELLALIVKYGTHLAFLLIEVFCFYLIINYNDIQRSIFINSTSLYTTKVSNQTDRLASYLDLQRINDSLQVENKQLLERIIQSEILSNDTRSATTVVDSMGQYDLLPVTVCNKTIHLRNNTFTLCQGSADGIAPMMGVTSATGVVGIVKDVSEHYASVISILHSQSRISCEIRGKYSFGNLLWQDRDPLRASLSGVPRHTDLSVGDTVITSGYSAVFPRGLVVGVVESFMIPRGSNDYDIDIRLANDVTTTTHAYVVQNERGREQKDLEDEG